MSEKTCVRGLEIALWVVEVFMRRWSEIDEGNVSMLWMSSELLVNMRSM